MDYTDAQDYTENPRMSPKHARLGLILTTVALLITHPVGADTVKLKPDHPERYTVVKGDTLWDIAKRFLQSPWHWPKVWKINQAIKNPHLIYPGDVILLRWVNGKPELSVLRSEKGVLSELPPEPGARAEQPAPVIQDGRTVKLTPRVHVESIEAAIPTIPPSAIVPFLSQPLAIGENELDNAGYITIGLDNRIALGDQSEFYARGLKDDTEYYHIFRPGKAIRHPDSGELLAYEAIYLGDARKLESGDPTKLVVTGVKQEILPTDRLLAAARRPAMPYYYPHPPSAPVDGRVVSALNAVAEIGPYTIVGVSLGKRDGMEEGHVLRVLRHVGEHRDPVTRNDYKLPDEESALLLIFRTYDKISYALVMSATRPVHMHDAVSTP
jgi:nucleoid-associated protein YgaU